MADRTHAILEAMIDSHVHLNMSDYRDDLDEVIERARLAGVTAMMNIGFDLASSKATVALTEKYPAIRGAVGVHPHDARTYTDRVEQELSAMLDKPKIDALGEIGLDYYRDLSPRDTQQAVFKRQLALARSKGKPIVIHCRDAFDDVMAILSAEGASYDGVFHAFSGDAAMARDVLSLGFHIGVGGVVTFKNARLREVVTAIPMDAIVLETDCPYLAPVPFRGKRNEPAYLRHVVEAISAATGMTTDMVVEQTNKNFARAMKTEH
jgi:TatD DNase family protein